MNRKISVIRQEINTNIRKKFKISQMSLFIEHFLHCFTEHHRACGELINEYVVRKTSRTMRMIGDNKFDQLM